MSSRNSTLIQQFTDAAELAGATTEIIHYSPDSLKKTLKRLINNNRTVVYAEPETVPTEMFASFIEIPGIISFSSEHQLVLADIGITDAFAGIARTGSVCLYITKKLIGAVSLFPRSHITILEAKNIVARPRDVFVLESFLEKNRPGDVVFITGPSATADMGSLERGVHGPGKLHIIILE